MQRLIKLHPLDNVQVLIAEVKMHEYFVINGQTVQADSLISIGHKVADQVIEQGQKIIKYGLPIGSATTTIGIGRHVHLHNMKSDYIPTYTIEKGFKEYED